MILRPCLCGSIHQSPGVWTLKKYVRNVIVLSVATSPRADVATMLTVRQRPSMPPSGLTHKVGASAIRHTVRNGFVESGDGQFARSMARLPSSRGCRVTRYSGCSTPCTDQRPTLPILGIAVSKAMTYYPQVRTKQQVREGRSFPYQPLCCRKRHIAICCR